ncbi:hypothetical protein KFE25_013419 [Diacronema lutheri]|uniref:U6 small nuclear RNA (adenine-(43)-N(6))-methyltransferase n=1 Tax=Diacronema lutheri TaxID=2081491 RepID=A0A8J6CEP9_DIALT|nr:hypothetical protein KFE25_013419 [Diacronema lutheri]
MHERNPYAARQHDFAELSRDFPALRPFCHAPPPGSARAPSFEWADPGALKALTAALLSRDFGVRWELPDGHLCPTVPSRLNYLLWLDDLIGASRVARDTPPPAEARHARAQPGKSAVRGVDIGTGASCIYPLLGHAALGWHFVGTEVDEAALSVARRNVALNTWEAAIELRSARAAGASHADAVSEGGGEARAPDAPLAVLREDERFDFVMCNPPFYHSFEDASRRPNPHTRREGTGFELVTAGGEVGFVGRLVAHSAERRAQVRWYSSLVGKKASLTPLLAQLRALRNARGGPAAVRVGTLEQGVTARWVLAWTFDADAARLAHGSEDERRADAAGAWRVRPRGKRLRSAESADEYAAPAPAVRGDGGASDARVPATSGTGACRALARASTSVGSVSALEFDVAPDVAPAETVSERVREAMCALASAHSAARAAQAMAAAWAVVSFAQGAAEADALVFDVVGTCRGGLWRAAVVVAKACTADVARGADGGVAAQATRVSVRTPCGEPRLALAPPGAAGTFAGTFAGTGSSSGDGQGLGGQGSSGLAPAGACAAARVDLAAKLRAAVERRGRRWRRLAVRGEH